MTRRCRACGATNRIPAARLHAEGKCGRCKNPLPATTSPIEVTNVALFDELIAHAEVPVLVDFWAAWCGPCRMVAPEVARVASDLAGRAVVVKVNTEVVPELAQRYRVSGIPNFAVFEGGDLVRQRAGAMRAAQLAALVAGERAA